MTDDGLANLAAHFGRGVGRWATRAACKGKPAYWFEVANPDWSPRFALRCQEQAARVCTGCPVRVECYDHAKRNGEVGVWGGHLFTVHHGRRRGVDLIARLRDGYYNERRKRRARGDAA